MKAFLPCPRPALAAALCLALALPAAAADPLEKVPHADALDAALAAKAPEILKHLEEKGAKVVGVLKFLVAQPGGRPTDNAGDLNMNLADRLEVALILALKPALLPDDELRVLHRASEVAAANMVPTHLDPAGRKRFFDFRYPPAWGSAGETLKPDRLLTGEATLSPDLKTLSVQLRSFGPDGAIEAVGEPFTVPMTPRILADTGHSYLLTPEMVEGARGVPSHLRNQKVVAATPKPERKDDTVVFQTPPQKEAPVRFEIRYDDKPVAVTDGRVPEPKEGTKVTFVVENVSDRTQGVVLKVNGQNVLFREESPHLLCHKWILKPGAKVTIPGFQETFEQNVGFKVLPPEESREGEMNYGPHAGLFQLAVFSGTQVKEEKPKRPEYTAQETMLAAISRGGAEWPEVRPGSLGALQAQLRKSHERAIAGKQKPGARGLIAGGDERLPKVVEEVYFKPDLDIPNYLLSVRYYTPKGQ